MPIIGDPDGKMQGALYVEFDVPPESQVVTWGPGKTIAAAGIAYIHMPMEGDTIEAVECKIGDGEFQSALLTGPAPKVAWGAELEIPAPGRHEITVRASRREGHWGRVVTRTFEAAHEVDLSAQGTTPRDYLNDLLLLAEFRVRGADGEPVGAPLLAETFHQPYDRVTDPDVGNEATRRVSRMRVAVEVLQGFLGDQADGVASSYPQEAYRALLRQLGTSYEELRLARGADAETRAALADRLGIDLDAAGEEADDPLEQLFLPLDDLGEADLERLFGLVDTRRDPLEPGGPGRPELLRWRQHRLRRLWHGQDHPASSDDGDAPPVVEPDLLDEADLADAVEGSPAFDLLGARRRWVDDELERIRQVREAHGDAVGAFAAAIGEFLGMDINTLDALHEQRERGEDIQPQLDEHQLGLSAFLWLLGVRRLAAAGNVLDVEWADVDAILVQVRKRRVKYEEWRQEDREEGLTISPDHFRPRAADAPPVHLPRWRATRTARRAWERTLQARLDQWRALERGVAEAVEAAESTALPLLRNALVDAASDRADGVDRNWLSQRLAIAIGDEGSEKRSRVQHAIETLQAVLFAVRTRRFAGLAPDRGDSPFGWRLDIVDEEPDDEDAPQYTRDDFDREWRWMGSYRTWRAAMSVFIHPENYLLPSLRERPPATDDEDQPTPFWRLVDNLRAESRLTRGRARELAAQYLRDVPERDETESIQEELSDEPRFRLTEQWTRAQLDKIRKWLFKEYGGRDDPMDVPVHVQELFFFAPLQIALQLQRSGEYLAALDWFRTVYAYDLPEDERKIYPGLALEEKVEPKAHRTKDWLLEGLNPHRLVNVTSRRPGAYTRFTLQSLVRCFLDYADAEFAKETVESLPKARGLYTTALELLNLPELQPPPPEDEEQPFPPNDVPQTLRRHAEANLDKLRRGRNIAGLKRHGRGETGAELTSGDGGLELAETALREATPYRYRALIDRAKQLVDIARQVESAYLSALAQRDAEAYTLLQAEQDIELTRATVELQDLRLEEANSGIGLANLQVEHAQIRDAHYQEWIDQGMLDFEEKMIASYQTAAYAQKEAQAWSSIRSTMQGALSGAMTGAAAGGVGALGGFVLGAGPSIFGMFTEDKATQRAIDASTSAQVASVHANFERRQQEWRLQKALAHQDIDIGEQQVRIAIEQLAVVEQEREIARIQVEHAEDDVQFLADQFTNAELYEWMSGVLGRVYAWFLQQAAATARLAQSQLSFERQAAPPSVIQADYWQATSQADGAVAVDGDGQGPDRRGLTGSARLLQDIFRLDQHAFETRQRKLQLSQTFSLARLVPYEFQQFRVTGVLSFDTPMELFDRAFPGHYMRLIRKVRTSVVALVPPVDGIRATLSTSGLSRVVTGRTGFDKTVVRRLPERIAFTAPTDATGVLELRPEDELLLPFETTGVDTSWQLEMPKPANPFDYRTIADVLLTIEYTALHSDLYRQQVIERLGRSVVEDRAFSVRDHFPDQWYDLHNPDQTGTPMTVQIEVRDTDFPPNLDELRVRHVLLYVVSADGGSLELDVERLRLITTDDTIEGGGATSTNGVVSTRRANASGWLPLLGRRPVGTWELALVDTPESRDRFAGEQIADILFVISYEGRAASWPS